MLRDRSQKGNNANDQPIRRGRKKEESPPLLRSPALESAKRQAQARESDRRSERRQPYNMPEKTRRPARNMSYAAEETLVRSATPRKSLPRSRSSVGMNSSAWKLPYTGTKGSWRSRVLEDDEKDRSSLDAISQEEQKRLAELEMRLPRVAGKIDAWLLTIVLTLLCVGLVMVYSASSFLSARYYGDASYFFQRQLLSAGLGVIVMLVTMRIDYRQWRRFSLTGMAISVPLLVLVLIVGSSSYGAARWLNIGSFFSFQPSELTKLALALYVADWLARKGSQVATFLYGLTPFVILVGLLLGLILLENDMGTAVIIASLAAAMFFTAGANIAQFLLAMGCGSLAFLTQAFKGYRYYRLIGFMNPFQYITSINLQLYQSLLALGSGGWFGVGLGASRQKTGYLPFPYIDSIFAIIGEELGFIGSALIVILFLFLAFRGFRLARRTQDVYGALLATGITTWLIVQAMINIGSSTGSIPYTGVPLPFITYGGTSLVVSLAAVGILLNISRYIQEPEVPALSKRALTKSFQ